ncbi:SPOR domain-containing protein [Porticoccus sp. GXU_MW_L64]
MSIFDDDNADPVATAKPGKKNHKNPFADPDERLEPLMDAGSELDDDELAFEEEDFEPLDRKRNRHLSSSLDKIRDNGPADNGPADNSAINNGPAQTAVSEKPRLDKKPANREKSDSQAVRNPFASSSEASKTLSEDNPFLAPARRAQADSQTPSDNNRQAAENKAFPGTKQANVKPREASNKAIPSQPRHETRRAASPVSQQKPMPQQPVTERSEANYLRPGQQTSPQVEPAPQVAPPEFARRQQAPIGVSSLTLWTLLAMAVLLAAWSMIQLSAVKEQLASLNNEVKQMDSPAIDSSAQEARLSRLENNYQALESRLQQSLTTGNSNQSGEITQLQKQLSQLQQKVQQQQKELQSAIATLKQQTKAAPPVAASKPVTEIPKPTGWVINIASLSNRDNALNLVSKAKALGTDTRVESYPSQGRTLYRVRAVGYSSQGAAEQAALRLQNGLGMSGLIVRKID